MAYHTGNQLIDPHLLFKKAHMQQGMHVADLGCGKTGHIVFPAAHVLGKDGVVYAVDIVKDVLALINKRAKIENMLHVHTVWSDVERIGGTAIPGHSLDLVFLVNALNQITNKKAAIEEAARLLKDKGRIAIVDWNHRGLPFAPKEESLLNFDELIALTKPFGFTKQEDFQMGKYHRGIILYRHN